MFTKKLDNESCLNSIEIHHAHEFFNLIDQNRNHLRQWLGWVDNTTCVEDTKRNIENTLVQSDLSNGFRLGIWYKSELAGVISYHNIDRNNKKTSLGYWLGEKFQGKGIMTKACAAFVNYAFNELELNRVEIRCAVENLKSRAIPERLGFKNEGTVRETEWLYDHFVDHVIYGMLVKDWNK